MDKLATTTRTSKEFGNFSGRVPRRLIGKYAKRLPESCIQDVRLAYRISQRIAPPAGI